MALDYHPAPVKGNAQRRKGSYRPADDDAVFIWSMPMARPPSAPARIPSRMSTEIFSRRGTLNPLGITASSGGFLSISLAFAIASAAGKCMTAEAWDEIALGEHENRG